MIRPATEHKKILSRGMHTIERRVVTPWFSLQQVNIRYSHEDVGPSTTIYNLAGRMIGYNKCWDYRTYLNKFAGNHNTGK